MEDNFNCGTGNVFSLSLLSRGDKIIKRSDNCIYNTCGLRLLTMVQAMYS